MVFVIHRDKRRKTARPGIADAAPIGVDFDFVIHNANCNRKSKCYNPRMHIKIVQVGKTKRDYEGLECEFLKRLTVFAKVENIFLKELDGGCVSQRSQKARGASKSNQEGSKKSALNADAFIVVLDERGVEFDSMEFAQFLKNQQSGRTSGKSPGKITFIIGGTFGLSDVIKKQADILLSLSKMTFTHQMTKIILLEQLYRAFCIISGKEYHY